MQSTESSPRQPVQSTEYRAVQDNLCNPLSLWVSVEPSEGMEIIFACVALLKWIVIYMHGQHRLARSPTRVGKKPNYGRQEVERLLGGNTLLVGRIPTVVGKKSDNGCHEVQQWLASMVGKKPTMLAEVQHGLARPRTSLARGPTMVGKKSNNG